MAQKRRVNKKRPRRRNRKRKAQRRPKKFVHRSVYNPQFLKYKKSIDFAVPSAELSRGTYGVYAYPSVGSASTTNYTYDKGAYYFAASDVPGITNYSSLFDQYRISGIKLTFRYISGNMSVVPSGTHPMNLTAELMVWRDFDDNTNPTTTNNFWQETEGSGRARVMRFPNKRNTMSIFLRPKVQGAILDVASGTTARELLGNTWLDGATTDAAMYGIKYMTRTPPSTASALVHTWAVRATYYFQFKYRVK